MSMSNGRSREIGHGEVADDHVDDNDFEHVVQHNQKNLEILKSLREKINWNVKKERREFLRRLYPLFIDWNCELPDLRNIFRDKEIERILLDSIQYTKKYHYVGEQIIKFVARSGYKNNPVLDKDGKPLLRYTTPIHYAVRSQIHSMDVIGFLFKIYNRFDVNYADEFGYTHFHVACKVDFYCIVWEFLEHGQDPNLLVPKTGDSPLHLAIDHDRIDVACLLMTHGADPSLPNKKGLTPVHVLCKTSEEWSDQIDRVKMFFKTIDEKSQTLKIDARDNKGRTPIHYAVSRFLPYTFDTLMNRGADLSNFVFPTIRDLDKYFKWYKSINSALKLQVTSGLLAIIECLEKQDYELDQSDVVTIMKFFLKHKLFQNLTDIDERWNDDEEFIKKSKNITISQNRSSFYDFLQMRPEEAEKQLTYAHHFGMVCSIKWCDEAHPDRERVCIQHLCKKLPRRFFRRWALYPFWELIEYRLPIECCEIILEELKHEDLCNVFLAGANQSS